jgi:signal transduction histidine kinase
MRREARHALRHVSLAVFGALLLVITFLTDTAWQPTLRTLAVLAAAAALAVPTGMVLGGLLGRVSSSWRPRELLDDAGSRVLGIDEIEGRRRTALGDPTLVDQLRQTRHVAEEAVNERAALERDLHDGAAQRVLSLQMGLAQARSDAGSTALGAALAQLERHAQLLHDDLRELSHGIFPSVLVDCGVVEALAEATLATNQRVRISRTIERMPRHLEHALYFTALEAVQNVLAHAGTWAIATVDFSQTADSVVCRISDDGVGFDLDGSAGHGLGLASMQERVTAVGGTLSIESAPGWGTSVVAEIPLPEESE